MLINWLPFQDDDDGKPQGGDAKPRPSDVLEQYGRDALRLAEKLADVQSDNYRLREERRNLKQQLTDAQGKVPAEGTRLLTKDEAAIWDAYAALGKPADIKQAMDANGTATAELATLKREKALTKAAEVAGFKASVLTTLAGDLDIQTKEKDGKPVVVVVKDGTETPLADYATSAWADFLPALKQAPATQGAPDINAGARGNGNTPLITEEDRRRVEAHYRHTF